jgi:hypothetical protein
MPRVDYFAIESGIETVLNADATLAGVTVAVEDELVFGAATSSWVGIYLDRRDAPENRQRLAAGQQTVFLLRFVLWCWEYSLEGIAKAIQRRDDLMGKVEVALMKQRTLNGTVTTSWLEGGEMPSGRVPGQTGWASGGEIRLVAEVKATTI